MDIIIRVLVDKIVWTAAFETSYSWWTYMKVEV